MTKMKYSKCNRCKREIIELPFKCRHCYKLYCGVCRLPEEHSCKKFKPKSFFQKSRKYKRRNEKFHYHNSVINIVEELKVPKVKSPKPINKINKIIEGVTGFLGPVFSFMSYSFLIMFVIMVIVLIFPSPITDTDTVNFSGIVNNGVKSLLLDGKLKGISGDNFSHINESHWGHMPLTFKFEDNGLEWQINETRNGFDAIERQTKGIVSFQEITDGDADISVYLNIKQPNSDLYQDVPNDFRIAGEGGFVLHPTIPNLIERGEIYIYNIERCRTGFPTGTTHEILHTFGFGHSYNSNDVMGRYSEPYHDCTIRKIEDNVINKLLETYG